VADSSPRLGASLSIEGGLTLREMVVKLDGHELSFLRSLELSMADDEVNTLTLTLTVDDVHVDQDVITQLQAIVKREGDER